MKKIFFVIAVMLMAVASCKSENVPDTVKKAFQTKFPNATNEKWDNEKAHEYEVKFDWNGVKYSANFSETGEWLETEGTISFDQLPEKVQKAFNFEHSGASIKAIAKIETSKGITKYEIEIKQSIKNVEILYTEEGIEIKE
jgi:uncharacterized membrane protein YkoI